MRHALITNNDATIDNTQDTVYFLNKQAQKLILKVVQYSPDVVYAQLRRNSRQDLTSTLNARRPLVREKMKSLSVIEPPPSVYK